MNSPNKIPKPAPADVLEGSLPPGYAELLAALKERIRQVQIRAALAADREVLMLYWQTGRDIVERQRTESWGRGVIERLARDLQRDFPGVKGFSASNIWRMRGFYLAYADAAADHVSHRPEFLARVVRELPNPKENKEKEPLFPLLPWGHHITLIEKVKDPVARSWYAQASMEYGWGRSVLALQIEAGLYERQGKAITNFSRTLPSPQSDLAQETLKNPYRFDFLMLAAEAQEREIEQALVDHIQKFLLELGAGFAFVGRQVPIEVAGVPYYLDLLFYHLRLRAFIVIELKAGAFKPEFAGKMNFYLSAVDDIFKHKSDNPTIGLLLCKEKEHLTVEYALRNIDTPIGVARWETQLVALLPDELRGSLPTVEELEKELSGTP